MLVFSPFFDAFSSRQASSTITSRRVLAELMKIIYKLDVDARYSPGWLFGAAKIDGKVVIGKIADAHCDNTIAMKPQKIDQAWKDSNEKFFYR